MGNVGLTRWGASFRSRLTAADLRTLHRAQAVFHLSTFLPLVLYHCKTSDEKPKFPATISYTIRHGLPRWTQHGLWLLGWGLMLKVLRGQASDRLTRLFGAQMVLTGIVAVIFCPLGQGKLSDKVHFVASGAYMVDHHFLLYLLGVKRAYCAAFYSSIVGFAMALRASDRAKLEAGIDTDETAAAATEQEQEQEQHDVNTTASFSVPGKRTRSLSSLPAGARRRIWWRELAVMILEYGLFTSFVSGMTSGVG